jgi:hypothetical protein
MEPCKALVNYEHSAVRFYICGEHAAHPVTNYVELDDKFVGIGFLKFADFN